MLIIASAWKICKPANTDHATRYALLYLVVFGSLIAYIGVCNSNNQTSPTLVSVYAYINPVVAITLGWLLLQEKMNMNMISGTVITLGVYTWLSLNLKNRKYEPDKIVDYRQQTSRIEKFNRSYEIFLMEAIDDLYDKP